MTSDRGDSGLDFPDDAPEWCNRVFLDNALWTEYGAGFDLRDLPVREYQAHTSLISGMRERERKEANKKK